MRQDRSPAGAEDVPEPLLLWVTRTAPYNLLTAHRLRAMGINVLAGPVLDIRPVAVSRPAGRPDALVFTSAHAVRHHPLEPGWREIPVYTVGDRTAEAAQRSGYRLIRSANGDVDDLQRLIRRTLPVSSRLFHFGARQTAGDLCGELVSVGYRASKHVVYEAAPAPASSTERIRAIFRWSTGLSFTRRGLRPWRLGSRATLGGAEPPSVFPGTAPTPSWTCQARILSSPPDQERIR